MGKAYQMKRLLIALLLSLFILPTIIFAQDALNLPTALYILLNAGEIERYGLGAEGVQTITAEGTFVVDFGIASDDNWFAYRSPEGLYVANVYDADDQLLVDESADAPPIRSEGDTLSWSPDDRQIAYVTLAGVRVYFRDEVITVDIPVNQVQHIEWSPSGEFLLAQTIENIWWVYRKTDTALNLSSVIPSSNGVSWQSDAMLIFAPAEGGLLTMDLNANNAQSTILAPSDIYHLPYQVGDGLYRVFRADGDTGFGRLLLLQISDENVVSEEIGEGDVELASIRWAPEGNLLIAFQGGVMALVDPISAQGFTLPITSTVAYDWGTVQSNIVDALTVTGDLYFLGEDVMGVRQVWTLADDGTPFSVTPATGNISDYDVSSDGTEITYISQDQLWLYDRDADELTSLITSSEAMHTPRFSPDLSRIIYSVETIGDNTNGGIWLYTIDEESNIRILANGAGGNSVSPPYYHHPQWAPNINALLVTADGSETTSLSILDVNTNEVVPIGQYDVGFWLQDGRVIAWGTGTNTSQSSEIVILAPNTQGDPIPLFTLLEEIIVEQLTQISANELRLITRQNIFGPSSQLMIQIPINGTFEPIGSIPPLVNPVLGADEDLIAGLTSPDGSLIIYDIEQGTQSILLFPIRIANVLWR